jgi:hypothetical protein
LVVSGVDRIRAVQRAEVSAVPLDPADILAQLQRMVALVPGALLAIVILAGPTATWLLYRFVVQPRARRFGGSRGPLLWICTDCRSANEVRLSRCYRCGLEREAIVGDLQVLDGDGLVALPTEIAYGWAGLPADTRPAAAPRSAPIAKPAATAAKAATPQSPVRTQPLAGKPRRLVAVGPGHPAATRAASPARRPAPDGGGAAGDGAASATPVPVTPRRRRSVAAGSAPTTPPLDDAR